MWTDEKAIKIIKFLEADFQLAIHKSPVSPDTLLNWFAKNVMNAFESEVELYPMQYFPFTAKSLDLIKKNFTLDSYY